MKISWAKAAVGAVLAVGVTAGAAAVGIGFVNNQGVTGTVTKIVDGDTLDVETSGKTERIRLLNVDTPEMSNPECLSIEAKEYLQERLPLGTEVTLRYDRERLDRYDRTLAGVFLGEELINASIAEAGFGEAVVFGSNRKFLGQVQEAEAIAKNKGLGIHGDVPEHCAVAEEFAQAMKQLDEAQQLDSGNIDGLKSRIGEVAAATAAAAAVGDRVNGLDDEGKRILNGMLKLKDTSTDAMKKAIQETDKHEAKLSKKRDGLIAKKKEAERKKAEAKRKAEEERKRKEAEAAAEAERKRQEAAAEAERQRQAAAAEAERQRQAEAERQRQQQYRPPAPPQPQYQAPAPQPKYTPPATQNSNPYPGYTGPRCYAPGGKTWKPCPNR